MKNIFIATLFIFFLLVFFIAASYKINPISGGITSYGDATYFYNYKDISLWEQNFGNGANLENTIFLYANRKILGKFLGFIGLNHAYISYFIWFLPILFCSLVYFILNYKLTKNHFFCFVAGIFVVFTNQSIEYLLFYPDPYFYAIGVLGIYIYISKKIYENLEIHRIEIVFIILLSLLLLHPFFLIIAILYWLVFLIFFLFRKYSVKNLFKALMVFSGFLLMGSYWLIPFFSTLFAFGNITSDVYSQISLNAVYQAYLRQGKIYDILCGWTYPNESMGAFKHILNNKVNILFNFIIWNLSILPLFFKKNLNQFQIILIILLWFFLGISFGPNNPLFASVWNYLWENVTAFRFFRSFSRFSIILIPIIVFILAISFNKISKKYKNILIAIFFIFLIVTRIKIFSGDFMGAVPKSYQIPLCYQQLNEKLANDKENYSIIRYPTVGYETYVWNKNRGYEYFPQCYYLMEYYLNKKIIYDKFAFNLREKSNFYKNLFPINLNDNQRNVIHTLPLLNGKYIMVNNDFINIISENKYAHVPSKAYNQLFISEGFEVFEKNEEFTMYKNLNYVPFIYAKSLAR